MTEHKILLKVTGMTCGGCAATVERALKNVAGVDEIAVDLQAGTAAVNTNNDNIIIDRLIMAVKLAGYDAHEISQ